MKKLALILACTSWSLTYAMTVTLPFELPWMNGGATATTYKSSDHSNGIFVVEAYFLGCPYCNNNAPAVNKLAQKFASEKRVQVLDVGIDKNESQYKEWIKRHKPNHPVLNDANRKLIRQLGTQGYPSTYVLDCKGNVVATTEGQWDAEAQADLEEAITNQLSKECSK